MALLLAGCGNSANETGASENAVAQDANDEGLPGRETANVAATDGNALPVNMSANTPTPQSTPPVDDLPPAAGNNTTSNENEQTADLTANPQAGKTITAHFRCIDGSSLMVKFDNQAGTAMLSRGDKEVATLETQRPASGMYYRSGGYVLRGKGREIAWSTPDTPPLSCTEVSG